MFFIKNEVIEINNEKSYLILDTTVIENEIFYQIQEVDEVQETVVGPKTMITTITEDGKLYIEDVVSEEKIMKLQEIFAS